MKWTKFSLTPWWVIGNDKNEKVAWYNRTSAGQSRRVEFLEKVNYEKDDRSIGGASQPHFILRSKAERQWGLSQNFQGSPDP